MRPVDQQTILVTGATDGLGKAVARELASRGSTVLLHGRDAARLEESLREIRGASGNNRLGAHRADFASLDDVRRLADEVERDHDRLDLLVNNAGLGAGSNGAREESADGHELRFAVNYLAPFLLTNRLLPLLRRSSPGRIVNVASAGQAPIDFDNIMLEHGYGGMRAYSQTKLALIMFTFDLAERLRAEGVDVTVNALHPASLMDTKMVRESFDHSLTTVDDGVEATLRLAIAPELDHVSGHYYERLQESRAHEQAYDDEARRRLWRMSEDLVGLPTAAALAR